MDWGGYVASSESDGMPYRGRFDRRRLVVYIENTGDCEIPSEAIAAVHSQKVILKWDKLSAELKDAIRHAHDAELPDGEDAEK